MQDNKEISQPPPPPPPITTNLYIYAPCTSIIDIKNWKLNAFHAENTLIELQKFYFDFTSTLFDNNMQHHLNVTEFLVQRDYTNSSELALCTSYSRITFGGRVDSNSAMKHPVRCMRVC